MERYVPIEKMSKKAWKELAKRKRGSWLGVNPTTRIIRARKQELLEKARQKEAFC